MSPDLDLYAFIRRLQGLAAGLQATLDGQGWGYVNTTWGVSLYSGDGEFGNECGGNRPTYHDEFKTGCVYTNGAGYGRKDGGN